jgi:site-specific recombinase XerD
VGEIIHIYTHSLRKPFVVISLKGGMSLSHIQSLMGHSTLKMTLHYARMSDDDLLLAHQEHGPVDTFFHG